MGSPEDCTEKFSLCEAFHYLLHSDPSDKDLEWDEIHQKLVDTGSDDGTEEICFGCGNDEHLCSCVIELPYLADEEQFLAQFFAEEEDL